jgi:alpha-mannosidase
VRLTLDAGATTVGVRITGVNTARDHRLRVVFATGIRDAAVWADAAFGSVQRRPLEVPAADRAMELPPPTAPLHRYVSLFAEARFHNIFTENNNTNFLPITAGIRFGG